MPRLAVDLSEYPGVEPHAPTDIADAILALNASGHERADLVALEWGGTVAA